MGVLILLLLAACRDRSRLNPYDPQNPNTQGRPTGLSVTAVLDTIRVSWEPMRLRDLTGYTLYRKLAQESDFSRLAELPPETHQYQEQSNLFGIGHSYRLVANVGDLSSPPSNEVTITPGPTLTWVADVNDGTLIKLTHDGRHELLRTFAFPAPARVTFDARRGNVWVLDGRTRRLSRINPVGRQQRDYDEFSAPVDLVLDSGDGCVWVADTLSNSLRRYDPNSGLQSKNDNLPKLAALAFNPYFNELWAIHQTGRELLRISKQAALMQRLTLPAAAEEKPFDIAVHAASGSAWLSLGGRVVRVDQNARLLGASSYAFRKALRLAVDQSSGECWVIDESVQVRASRVLKLDVHGNVLLQCEGFDRPQGLAVNPFDATCYVADSWRSRVVQISKSGEMQTIFSALRTPIDVEVVSLLP